MASVKLQKVTLQRLKPFSATPKPPEASAEAPEQPTAASAAAVDPTADAEQFVQHAEANGCEALLHAASLGIHGRSLGKLLHQVSSLFCIPSCPTESNLLAVRHRRAILLAVRHRRRRRWNMNCGVLTSFSRGVLW